MTLGILHALKGQQSVEEVLAAIPDALRGVLARAEGARARGAARLRAPGDGRDVALGPRPTTPRASRKCSGHRVGAQGTRLLAGSLSIHGSRAAPGD